MRLTLYSVFFRPLDGRFCKFRLSEVGASELGGFSRVWVEYLFFLGG